MPRTKNNLRSIACVALCAFGCATFRQPASASSGDFLPKDGIVADPQIELTLESAKEVLPSETTAARQAARDALQKALARRVISPGPLGADDPVLVVRERAVARTESRRHDQTAAKIGVAVGIVLVVAAIVVLAVSGKGSKGAPATAANAKAVPKAVPVGTPVVIPPPPVPRPVPPPVVVRPFAPVFFQPYFGFQWWLVAEPRRSFVERDDDDAWVVADQAPVPVDEPPPVVLPPLEELDVEHRGFFDGDETLLDFVLADRSTGRVLWAKSVRRDADARDPSDMEKLVDEALEGQHWAFRRAPPPQSR